MSDISLYSGLYETIRHWADLIDDMLISLKESEVDAGQKSYKELQELFSTLAQGEDHADFSDQRVVFIIESKLERKVEWSELANNLKDPTRQRSTIPTLEEIAQCLAEKHADTVAKMRWGHP